MPVKGYDSVNLPSGLYKKVKDLVKNRKDLGYRSVTEFVAEAVRKRTEEIEKLETLRRSECEASGKSAGGAKPPSPD